MKAMKWQTLVIGAAIVVAAVGSSALTSIHVERTVAGKVLADSDSHAAVQIKDLTGGPSFLDIDANGKYTFDLNDAINKSGVKNTTNTTSGFNPDALFYIGNDKGGAFEITNNTDVPVTLSLTNASTAITVRAVSGDTTIGAGASKAFYFVVNTASLGDGTALTGTLQIDGTK
jgi:hypothetical protein